MSNEIQAGDVVQVDPSAGSDFAGCYCRVNTVEGCLLGVRARLSGSLGDRLGLVLRHQVQRIGRSAWYLAPRSE